MSGSFQQQKGMVFGTVNSGNTHKRKISIHRSPQDLLCADICKHIRNCTRSAPVFINSYLHFTKKENCNPEKKFDSTARA